MFDSSTPLTINFKRGDVVKTIRGIAVIVDVLESRETDNLCLYVRFVDNIGNSRKYDMLELTPGNTLGVEEWQLATREEFLEAIENRRRRFEKELAETVEVANDRVTVR